MKTNLHPLRVGLFTLAGIALLVVSVVVVSGGQLFAQKERGVLHFPGTVYGLQVGSPVVLRGVRVGSVVAIGLRHDPARGGFVAPVTVSINKALILDAQGRHGDETAGSLASLVAQGLRGELAVHSLLTGQQYVDLSVVPPPPGAAAPMAARVGELVEIPTRAGAAGALAQLQSLDLKALVDNLSAAAMAAREVIAGGELKQGLADLSRMAASLARVSNRLDQRLGPMADGLDGTLAESRRAAKALAAAAERIGTLAEKAGRTADRIGGAAERAEALLAPDAALPRSLQQAAEQVAQGAQALQRAAGDDSALMQGVDGTLLELRRTARAVRELAELLERQPDALIRGR